MTKPAIITVWHDDNDDTLFVHNMLFLSMHDAIMFIGNVHGLVSVKDGYLDDGRRRVVFEIENFEKFAPSLEALVNLKQTGLALCDIDATNVGKNIEVREVEVGKPYLV